MKLVLLASLLLLTSSIHALHEGQGGACHEVGGRCSCEYQSLNNSPSILVLTQHAGTYISSDLKEMSAQGYCAFNGYCADNGAYCETEKDCYNDCGTNSICAGSGAYCESREAFIHTEPAQTDMTCYTPGTSDLCELAVCADGRA